MAIDPYPMHCRSVVVSSVFVLAGGSLLFYPSKVLGQSKIVPDQTLGQERSQVQSDRNGRNRIIGGATRGRNLFHSFRDFNVAENQSVYFASGNKVQNILSRITGGNESRILGTLGTLNPSNPNLFLINPNGIVFGKNAKLDVGGSFFATTADSIQLGNSGVFSASEPQTSRLMTVQPSALFFSELNQSGAIVNRANSRNFASGSSVNGLPAVRGLQANEGESLIFVGSRIRLDNGQMRAPKGNVELAGIRGAGSVRLALADEYPGLQVPDDIQRGNISFTDGSLILIPGESRGQIAIHAQRFNLLNGSGLITRLDEGTSGTRAANITINATEGINLASFSDSEFGTIIGSAVLDDATGNSGDISIETPVLRGRGDVSITSSVLGQGHGGDISIKAGDRISITQQLGTEASGIVSGVGELAIGNGGDINIQTSSFRINNAYIVSASNIGRGNAGTVTLQASENVTIQGGSSLQAFTLGAGQASNVTIEGQNGKVPRIRFEGTGINGASNISTFVGSQSGQTGSGGSGNIIIKAKSLFLSDDATLTARSFAPDSNQNAGNIEVSVRENLIGIKGAKLRTSTSGPGNAGDIQIKVGDNVLLRGRGDPNTPSTFIESVVDNTGSGKAGDITIKAGQLLLQNGAVISTASSSEVAQSSQADAGDILLNVDRHVDLSNGSRLTSFSFGKGRAGNISVNAGGDVSFAGTFTGASSGSALESTGKGGDIQIKSNALSLSKGAFLETASISTAEPNQPLDSGQISISVAKDVKIGPGAFLTSFSNRYGNAGDITIQAGRIVSLDGLDQTSALSTGVRSFIGSDGRGNGGDIRIKAASLSLKNGVDFSASTAGKAISQNQLSNAGNIDIQVDKLVNIDNRSNLSSITDGQGNAGRIEIQAGKEVWVDRASTLSSSVGSNSTGRGGDIQIKTQAFKLTNGSQLFTSTLGKAPSGQRNDAGNIDIQARASVLINRDSKLVSSTFGQGDAGNVSILSDGLVALEGRGGQSFSTGIFSTVGLDGVGQGGEINVAGRAIALKNASTINADTFGLGDAGRISLQSDGATVIQNSRVVTNTEGIGSPGEINVQTRSLTLSEQGTIGSNVLPPSNPAANLSVLPGPFTQGDINIIATDQVDISGFSSETGIPSGLFARTAAGGVGPAGNIEVTTRNFKISNGGSVDATTSNPSPGGQIMINANNFEALTGGQVFTSTSGSGNAGTIQLNVKDTLTLSGSDPTYFARRDRFGQDAIRIQAPESGIYANTALGSSGTGGMIQISATQTLNLTDKAVLTSRSEGEGAAGRININIPGRIESNDGNISTRAVQGAGGRIQIKAADLRLRGDSDIRTDVSGGEGGDISIQANSVIAFDDSDIFAFARSGEGGDIRFNTPAYFGENFQPSTSETNLDRLDGNNRADVNASGAIASGVIIQPDNSFVESSLIELPDTLINTNQLMSNSCVAPSKEQGSFILSGPSTLPHQPNDGPASQFPTGTIRPLPTDQGLSSQHRSWKIGDPIEEPQNVYRLSSGKLILGRTCSH